MLSMPEISKWLQTRTNKSGLAVCNRGYKPRNPILNPKKSIH